MWVYFEFSRKLKSIIFRFGVTFCLVENDLFEHFSRMIKNSLNKEHEWDTVFCYRLLLAFDRISS